MTGESMSIVIFILKIIGILLLTILGLLVLTVACLLFVPVRYRIWGEIGEKIDIHVRASWLLHIVSFRAEHNGKVLAKKLRVFGIPLRARRRKTKKPEKKKRKTTETEEESVAILAENEEAVTLAEEEIMARSAGNELTTATEANANMETAEKNRSCLFGKKKKSLFAGILSILQKIRQLPGMIRSRWETLKEKTTGFKETLNGLLTELKKEQNLEALKTLWNELRLILKHSSPGRIRAEASFSLGDPANTGQALGAISMIPFLYRYPIHLYPDFESERIYFEGTFDIRGRVFGIHALILLIHLFFDKNIRGLMETYHK